MYNQWTKFIEWIYVWLFFVNFTCHICIICCVWLCIVISSAKSSPSNVVVKVQCIPRFSSVTSLINRSIPSKNMNGDQMCTRTVARNQSEVNISCHTVHLNLSYLFWFWISLMVFHIFLIFFQSVIRNTIRRLLKVNKIYI